MCCFVAVQIRVSILRRGLVCRGSPGGAVGSTFVLSDFTDAGSWPNADGDLNQSSSYAQARGKVRLPIQAWV